MLRIKMQWDDQVNEMASGLEKFLKKITHRAIGLEHEKEKKPKKRWFFKDKKISIPKKEDLIISKKEEIMIENSKPTETSAIIFSTGNEKTKTTFSKILPTRVSKFDHLISDGGLEAGSTILISGGAGTGKTTFSLQSIYHGALEGEKGIYLSFEEQPEKIRNHMKKNFGMDFKPLEKKGVVAIMKIDPAKIARSLEESMLEREGGLKIELKKIEFPFVPDRICIDSLSALSIAFEKEETYRKYLRELFESLESSKAVSFVLTETEQNPTVYSRTGVEEFLADGVVVLYNMKKQGKRENALEILKLRSSKHKKGLVPYRFSPKGIEITV